MKLFILLLFLVYVSFGVSLTLEEYGRISIAKYLIFPLVAVIGYQYKEKGVILSSVILLSAYVISMTYLTFMYKYIPISEYLYVKPSKQLSLYMVAFLILVIASNYGKMKIKVNNLPVFSVIFLLAFLPSLKLGVVYIHIGAYLLVFYLFLLGYSHKRNRGYTISIILALLYLANNTFLPDQATIYYRFESLRHSLGYYLGLLSFYIFGFLLRNKSSIDFSNKKVFPYMVFFVFFIAGQFLVYTHEFDLHRRIFSLPDLYWLGGIIFFSTYFLGVKMFLLIAFYYCAFFIFAEKEIGYLSLSFVEKINESLTGYGLMLNYKLSYGLWLSFLATAFFGIFFKNLRKKSTKSDFEDYSTMRILPYMVVSLFLSLMAILIVLFKNINIGFLEVFVTESGHNIIQFLIILVVSYYAIFILIPIGLASVLIERNGIKFTKDNFPEYEETHAMLKDNREILGSPNLYVVSTNKLGSWGWLSARFLKLYSSFLPFISSSVFNEITKGNESELQYLIYKEQLKINFNHYKWWWYLYPLTLVPILNLVYTYARRKIHLQASLFAYYALSEAGVVEIDTVVKSVYVEETEAGLRYAPSLRDGEIQKSIISTCLEYFSPRPHTKTIVNEIELLSQNKNYIIERDGRILKFRES